MDFQLVIVAVAAGAAGVYAIRQVLLQFQRPDDQPAGCQGCPANRTGRAPVTYDSIFADCSHRVESVLSVEALPQVSPDGIPLYAGGTGSRDLPRRQS